MYEVVRANRLRAGDPREENGAERSDSSVQDRVHISGVKLDDRFPRSFAPPLRLIKCASREFAVEFNPAFISFVSRA
jgi:hypothetical protein